MQRIINKIKTLKEQYPQLVHAANIITKYEAGQHLHELRQIAAAYLEYITANLRLNGYSEDIVAQRVQLLNTYYNFLHDNGFDTLYSAQGKFRPSVLEEFLFLLFKDYVDECRQQWDAMQTVDCGSVKAYTNLFFKARSFDDFVTNAEIAVNEKDQDFAIYRSFRLNIDDDKVHTLQVPAVAIEAKTYIDKTMLDGIIATAEKVKSGNPYAMFIAVAEYYDVASEVDPAYSRINQIYILRKSRRRSAWQDIDRDVVCRMVADVLRHLQRPWSDVNLRLIEEGVII